MQTQPRSVFRSTWEIGPHQNAHLVALRAAFCLAIPLLVLYLIDRTDLAMYSSFGAFTAIYGRNDAAGPRLFMQTCAGAAIVLAMLTGTAISIIDPPDAVKIMVIALIAGITTVVSFQLGWRPTGPMFATFASGACAMIPATSSSLLHVILVGGGAYLFSLLVTIALALRRLPARELRITLVIQKLQTKHVVNAITIVAATLIAGWIGLLLFDEHWYWAMIATIAVLTGANIHARLTRGVQRFLGTAIGVFAAAGILEIDPPVVWVLVIAVVCQGIIELVVLRNYAMAMISITVIALLMVNMATSTPASTIIQDRVLETLLGVVVGMVATIVVQLFDID